MPTYEHYIGVSRSGNPRLNQVFSRPPYRTAYGRRTHPCFHRRTIQTVAHFAPHTL